jgi:hypothetical protein
MQEGNVVLWLFIPTNKDPAKAIHPTMGAFHDPSSCPLACLLFDSLCLFASGANMGRKAKLFQDLAHRWVIVAFVQTHPLWLVWGGLRPLHHDTLDAYNTGLPIPSERPSAVLDLGPDQRSPL